MANWKPDVEHIVDNELAELKDASNGDYDLAERRDRLVEIVVTALDSVQASMEAVVVARSILEVVEQRMERFTQLTPEQLLEALAKVEAQLEGN